MHAHFHQDPAWQTFIVVELRAERMSPTCLLDCGSPLHDSLPTKVQWQNALDIQMYDTGVVALLDMIHHTYSNSSSSHPSLILARLQHS